MEACQNFLVDLSYGYIRLFVGGVFCVATQERNKTLHEVSSVAVAAVI